MYQVFRPFNNHFTFISQSTNNKHILKLPQPFVSRIGALNPQLKIEYVLTPKFKHEIARTKKIISRKKVNIKQRGTSCTMSFHEVKILSIHLPTAQLHRISASPPFHHTYSPSMPNRIQSPTYNYAIRGDEQARAHSARFNGKRSDLRKSTAELNFRRWEDSILKS